MAEQDVIDTAGAVGIDVIPEAPQWGSRLRAATLPEAERVGKEIAKAIARPISAQVVAAVSEGVRNAGTRALPEAERVGRTIGDRIGREVRRAVEARLRTAISVKIEADTSRALAKIREVDRRMSALSGTRVRVDVENTAALSGIREVKQRLDALSGTRVRIDADNSQAISKINAVAARLAALGSVNVRIRINTAAASADITRVRSEIRALAGTATVTLNIRVSGQNSLRQVETQLARIGTMARTGIDVRAVVTGSAEVRQLTRDVRALQRVTNPLTIDIRTRGFMQSLADMHTLSAFARTLGATNPTITVTVNASLALLRLATILGLARAVGAQHPVVTVNINVTGLPGAQAGLAGVQGGASAASGSVGLLAAAIALLALIAIPALAAIAAALGAIAVAAVAAVAGAGVLLLGLMGVFGAVQAINEAQKQGGKSAAEMAQKQNQLAASADGIRSAEQGLARAQRDARAAQEGLTRSRKEAKEANEDLEFSVRGNRIQQERAADDLKQAKADYEKVIAPDSGATAEQRKAARLAFEEAQLQFDQLGKQGERLAAEKADADRKGIEGSDQVVAAQQRIADANERVVDAQRQVAAAHRQAAEAARGAGDAGNTALEKMRTTLAGLTPEGRRFALFVAGLKDELGLLRHAAERSFLPGLQRGMEAFLPVLPLVVKFVERFGVALGDLAERGLRALTAPFWVQFFDWLATEGVVVLDSFVTAAGWFIRGLAAMVQAFGPFAVIFGEGLSEMGQNFARWAEGLTKSKGFQSFIDYVRESGPRVLTLLGQLTILLIRLGIALAPLATVTIEGLILGLEWLNAQDPGVVLGIAAAIATLIAVIVGGPVAIVIATVAIAGALVYLYNKFEWFRDVSNAVWAAIVAYVKFIYNYGYKPVFTAIVFFLTQVLAPAWTWLWKNVLVPAWEGISAAAIWAWRYVLKPTFDGIVWLIREVLGPIFLWLYRNVIKPVFDWIVLVIRVDWAIIQVIFGIIQIAVKIVAAIFVWLYENVIRPIWRGISAVISSVWGEVRPVFEAFGGFIERNVAPAFQRGVSALGKIWSGLKEIAKVPVRFIVDSVLNNGLLAAYNWVAKKFNVTPNDVRIPVPEWLNPSSAPAQNVFQGHAAGGFITGPGSGTSDSIMARLSNGEYVIPAAIVKTFGVDFFDWLIGKRESTTRNVRPGDGSEGLAFADGGLVGWLKGAWNSLSDPLGALSQEANKLLAKVPGGPWLRDVVTAPARDTVGKVVHWIQDKITNLWTSDGYAGPISADVASVRNWVAAQAGKPYIWAAAGPQGYDCSGIVSAAWNLLHGRTPYSHTFSTHYMDRFFPQRNVVGPLTAGWSHAGQREGGSVGHTAANIAGLPFESRGSRGVLVGADVRPFANFAQWGTFDSGGWLMPGLTYAQNNTGKPEAILTDQQWKTLAAGQRGGGDTYVTNVHPARAELRVGDLEALDARRAALSRIRRQR